MMYMSRHINHDKVPEGKTVFGVRVSRRIPALLVDAGAAQCLVCVEDPCLPVAVSVRAPVGELYRVYMGRSSLRSALEEGTITLDGLPRGP